ncbi:MAG: polysaccharide biosynthesis C-terminal domain-containing protein [Anaerolineae bacterium]|nr:polysaccharide biosynthesis C-terminal domain-containing protein [Anaerolineae bacterium]
MSHLNEAAQPRRKTLWFTSLYTLFASLVVVASNFMIDFLVARTLGPEGKGNYALLINMGYLFMVLLGQSITTGVAYLVSQNRAALGRLSMQLLGIGLIQVFVAFGLLAGVQHTPLSPAFLPPGAGLIVLLLGAALPVVQNLQEYWRHSLVAHNNAYEANQLVMAQRMLQVGFVLVLGGLYLWGGLRFDYVLVVSLTVLSFAIANILFLRKLSAFFTWGDSGLKEIITFSIPCYLGDLFKILNYRMDIFFVSFFQGAREVGFYSTAVGTANLILMIAQAFAINLFPKVASSQDTPRENALRTAQIVRIILWFNLVCSVGLGLVSFWLLPFLYGEVFINSVTPLLLLLPGTLLLSLTFVLSSYINGIGKPRVNTTIAVISLAVTVVLDILLIPAFSKEGAAIASSLAYSISAMLTLAYFVRDSHLPLRRIFLLNRDDLNQLLKLVDRLKSRIPGF